MPDPQEQPPSWDILIASILHRHATLCELLADLDGQWQPGLGVRLYRDNLEAAYGDKIRVLLESSSADYVSCVDDDDLLAPGGVARVMTALAGRPDYTGFAVHWTRNGTAAAPVEHSLRHGGWGSADGTLLRDLSEKNPIRREIALLGPSGRCVTEAWIPPPAVYLYRENTGDTFLSARMPLPGPLPELPSYRWLTEVAP
jgi:hypothetical protein